MRTSDFLVSRPGYSVTFAHWRSGNVELHVTRDADGAKIIDGDEYESYREAKRIAREAGWLVEREQ